MKITSEKILSIAKTFFVLSLVCSSIGIAKQANAEVFACPAINQSSSCPAGQTVQVSDEQCPTGMEPVSCIMGAPTGGVGVNIVIKWCCIKPSTADPVADRCTPPVRKMNSCEVPNPEPGLSYECMTQHQATLGACSSVGGGEPVNNISMTYPGCGATEGCCISPVCEVAVVQEDTPTGASAATTYTLENPLGTTNLNVIAKNVINTFLGIVGALALLVFVYAGVTYLIAGGSEGMVKKSQDTMKYAVIGIVLIMFSYVITDSFISLWTTDLPTSLSTDPAVLDEDPTVAEQEVTTLQDQQQAAIQAESDAKSAASSSNQDICGSTSITGGYSCMTLTPAEQANYDCLSGYCQSNKSSNYLCCKAE
jgi:Type IV secretion system pilin